MKYINVLNHTYASLSEKLFSIIYDLYHTPYENDLNDFMEESKKTLRKLLFNTPEQIDESDYAYHKLNNIIYYQNGLCECNNKYIDLGTFTPKSNIVEENIRKVPDNADEILKYAENISHIHPLVACQLFNFANPNYKFKRLYNGYRGSFERIIHNCEVIQKELNDPNSSMNDRKKEIYNDGKKIALDIMYQIVSDHHNIVLIDTNHLDDFIKTYDEKYFVYSMNFTYDEENFVECGNIIIDFLRNQNDEVIDIAGRMRILDR